MDSSDSPTGDENGSAVHPAPLSPQELRSDYARSLEQQAKELADRIEADMAEDYPRPQNVVDTSRWKAYNPTGAFDSAAVSLRLMPRGYYWREIAWSMFLLYGAFVGIPVAGGVWAAWRIGLTVGWW